MRDDCLLQIFSSVRKAGGDYRAYVDQAVLNSSGRKPPGEGERDRQY
jgi:hypothetical protein